MAFRKNKRTTYLRPDRVERATIGTHVPHGSRPRRQSNPDIWKAGKSRHQIADIRPQNNGYHSRLKSNSFALQNQKSSRIRKIIIVVVIILAAIALAAFVGFNVYTGQVNSRMALAEGTPASLKTPANSTDPYYVLIEGQFGESSGYSDSNMLELVRIDPQNKQATIISVPTDIQVGASGQTHDIGDQSSDDALISAVADYLHIDIAHFVRTDAQGLSNLVDMLGGIEVNLVQEVDDPDVGSDDISAGQQLLNGTQTVEVCRANNYSSPNEIRRQQQQAVLEAVLGKMFDGQSGWAFLTRLDSLSDDFKTDLQLNQIQTAVRELGPFNDAKLYTGVIPGIEGSDSTGSYYTVSDSLLSPFMDIVNSGGDPQTARTQGSANPSDVTVTVLNGAGTTGGAATVSNQLRDAGYQVPTSGNTDSYVYDETLVIYKTDDQEATAESIVELLGCGRTVSASIYYSFDTDIEVIIGKDWAPAAS